VRAAGELSLFRPGIARILERNPVPVLPMAVSGLWGSIFSRRDGKVLGQPWKARPFRPIALAVGEPVAAGAANPERLREQVLALRGDWR
jgi:1-acyl-sn-glycerol-3-phosphate acyltransferase